MEFEEIVTDVFVDYKVGFVNGKNDILNLIIGNISFEEFSDIEDWYSMGYEDGYAFYLEYYKMTGQIPIEFLVGSKAWQIVKDSFLSRVTEYNRKNNKSVPALTLLLNNKR